MDSQPKEIGNFSNFSHLPKVGERALNLGARSEGLKVSAEFMCYGQIQSLPRLPKTRSFRRMRKC